MTMTEPRLNKPLELTHGGDWTRGNVSPDDVWDVLTAARLGDVPRLEALLARVPGIVDAEFWYVPPIHFAVREGHLEAVELLVRNGANLTHRSLYGNETLLQIATDRGHERVASYLRDRLGESLASDGERHAIHAAVQNGDLAEIDRLLAGDATLCDRRDHAGRRPLHYAVETGRRDVIDALLDRGADINASGNSADERLGGDAFTPIATTLWHHAYWRQRSEYDLARHLIDRGAHHSITIAAALGDETRVRACLNDDRSLANDRERYGKRPVSAAAERNHSAIVRMLLAAGADPNLEEGKNCPGGYALWAASHCGYREIAEELLAAGANPNADVESSGNPTESAKDDEMRALMYRHGGRVRLSCHFFQGQIDTVAALLDARPELFDEVVLGQAFTHCVKSEHEHLIQLLLSRGLRVPGTVTGCQTYLWSSNRLARLLLESGMDPNLPNWQEVRPLHHMAARGDIDNAKLFLEFGADREVIDEEYHSTPLAWAARCGQTDFARFLLSPDERYGTYAADPNPPASPGWAKPIEWAKRRKHEDMVELLKAHSSR